MQPLYYFDVTVRGTNMQDGVTMSLPVMARLLRILHGYFAHHPNKFAIAFPRLRMGEFRHPGNIIRVFAESRDEFDGVEDWIGANERVAPYVTKSYVLRVDPQKIFGWMEYRRYRIPSRNSRLLVCRDNRIKSSEEVPYLRMSSSCGEAFSMHISASPGVESERCTPTSYGLSGEARFSLPVLK